MTFENRLPRGTGIAPVAHLIKVLLGPASRAVSALAGVLACITVLAPWAGPAQTAGAGDDSVIFPAGDSAIQMRLYTNASPNAPHVFNTFGIEAFGESLLRSSDAAHCRAGDPDAALALNSVLINGAGPNPAATNHAVVLEKSSGSDWQFLSLDVTPAYRDRVRRYTRNLLYIAPDLLVVFDRVTGIEPVSFQMILHPPSATRFDSGWRDLRLDSPKAHMIIHSPGRRRDLRPWVLEPSPVGDLIPGTVIARLSPTNKLGELNVLTVFAIRPAGGKRDYVFKLLESDRAIGAQIQRDGLPTIVAFNTVPGATHSSLVGFQFTGPAGVYVFKPKTRPAQTAN